MLEALHREGQRPDFHQFLLVLKRFLTNKRPKLPEHLPAPASHSGEEPRAEISSRVYGIAAVQTHGDADGHDGQADAERLHAFWGADVLPVGDGQDAQDQRSSGNNLPKQKKHRIIIKTMNLFWVFRSTGALAQALEQDAPPSLPLGLL